MPLALKALIVVSVGAAFGFVSALLERPEAPRPKAPAAEVKGHAHMDSVHDALVAIVHDELPHGPARGPVRSQVHPKAAPYATANVSPPSKKRAMTGKKGNRQEKGTPWTKEITVPGREK